MTTSRKGKHRQGKVSIGLYIEEEKRALLAYLVDMTGQTATDIIMDGVSAKARGLGVLDSEGRVVPEHRHAIAVIMEAYRHRNKKGGAK